MKPDTTGKFVWRIAARTQSRALPEDWRAQLVARLGYRPRRVGLLAELALYGALKCLDEAGEARLPQNDVMRLCSMRGPRSAIFNTLEQIRTDMPLPFSFLQSQTSQLLPALAVALEWQGDASIILARDAMDIAKLACHQAGSNGMLLGWVEEEPASSFWLRLVPCAPPSTGFVAAASFNEMASAQTDFWRLENAGVEIAPKYLRDI